MCVRTGVYGGCRSLLLATLWQMSTSSLVQAPTETITRINDDLDTLEELLKPLLAKPLSETLDELPVLDRAKLCTLIPYVIHSLVMSRYYLFFQQRY